MLSLRISKTNKNGIYFLNLTVANWYYLLDRHNRWKILADSLNYFIDHKQLKIYAYVFMINHIHLIIDSNDCIGFVRDFKKFTSKKLKENIVAHEPHILSLFTNNSGIYRFWEPTNVPLLVETEKFLMQKIEYIHNNPVKKSYVSQPEYWYWSSANPDSPIQVVTDWWG